MTAAAVAYVPPARAPLWTPAEDTILRDNYQRLGAQRTADVLGRTLGSTHHRAHRLKIFTHARWSKADDRKLTFLWGAIGIAAIAKDMKRTEDACYFRAKCLGLTRGLQPGMEFVRHAAERTGYSPPALERILAWHGISPQRTMSRPIPGAAYRRRMVDPEEVDEAIREWMASEVVNDAARRRGIDGGTLTNMLTRSGLKMPPRPPGRRWWRVPTETIDAVIAQRRSTESVAKAAKRVGVSRCTLSELLKDAGATPRDGRLWRVDPQIVDRVVAAAIVARPKLARYRAAAAVARRGSR